VFAVAVPRTDADAAHSSAAVPAEPAVVELQPDADAAHSSAAAPVELVDSAVAELQPGAGVAHSFAVALVELAVAERHSGAVAAQPDAAVVAVAVERPAVPSVGVWLPSVAASPAGFVDRWTVRSPVRWSQPARQL